MYKVKKRIEVSSAHCLALDYESKCKNMHGHNWIVEVEISGENLNKMGMLCDFTHIKKIVMQLDHANINEVVEGLNPTAENIAKWIAYQINLNLVQNWVPLMPDVASPWVSMVTVQESEGNIACYIP